MQESGKAYLNGQLVDFSEFRVAPDLIQEFITETKDKAPDPAPDTSTKGDGTSETSTEDEDGEEGLAEEEDRDALIAACAKKALEDTEQGNTPRVPESTGTEDKPLHPFDIPDRLVKGPHNSGLLMFAASGRPPKDYRSRLMRRALAESSAPTLTTSELMNRIRDREPGAGGSQWRLHIQVPGEVEGYPVVFFTTHPDKVVRINGIPATRHIFQNVMSWCGEIVKPIPGGNWIGDGYLEVEPRVYFDGVQVSLSEVPDLIRAHGVVDLLEPLPAVTVLDGSSDVSELLFGQESKDTRRVKAFIAQGLYLENSEGDDPYDVYSGW